MGDTVRITERKLRRVIRKALLREAFRGEGQFIEDLTPEQIAMWEFGYEIGAGTYLDINGDGVISELDFILDYNNDGKITSAKKLPMLRRISSLVSRRLTGL